VKLTTDLQLAPRSRISRAILLLPLYLHDVDRRNFTFLPIALRSRLKLYQAGHLIGLTDCHSVNVTLRAKPSRSAAGTERGWYKKGLNKISRDRKCIVYEGVFGVAGGGRELPETEMYCECVC